MANGRENLSAGGHIAAELVGNQLPRRLALLFQNLAKEACGSFPVSVTCDQNIQHVTVLVHRSPKIMTFAADGNEQLIHVPDVAGSTLSLPQSTSIRWSKLPAPESNGFVGYGDATLSEKVLDIAKAQSEPMVQPDGIDQTDFLYQSL